MWIPRSLRPRIEILTEHFPALLVTGARQTGKTSLLRTLFPERRFVSLDLPSLEEVFRSAGIPPERGQALYHVLSRAGRLVKLRGGLTFHADALTDLKQRLLNFRQKSETIDVAAFKERPLLLVVAERVATGVPAATFVIANCALVVEEPPTAKS